MPASHSRKSIAGQISSYVFRMLELSLSQKAISLQNMLTDSKKKFCNVIYSHTSTSIRVVGLCGGRRLMRGNDLQSKHRIGQKRSQDRETTTKQSFCCSDGVKVHSFVICQNEAIDK